MTIALTPSKSDALDRHATLTNLLAEAQRDAARWAAQEVGVLSQAFMTHAQLSVTERDRTARHLALHYTQQRMVADAEVAALRTEIEHVRRLIDHT